MRLVPLLVLAATSSARAGVLDFDLGAQATTTAWPDDHGGGASLGAGFWFTDHFGAAALFKEQYATVDDRYLSYFSLNASAREPLGPVRATAMLGLVHQHEETRAAAMAQPGLSVVGVADGIRHRFATRGGLSFALPVRDTGHGDVYVALDLDGTLFSDTDKGPQWMASAGLSLGLTWDLAR